MPWQRKADAPYVVVTDAGFWSVALARFTWLQFLAPTLGGETIDVTTFCAAGPEWEPPVTMADIIILGVAEDWQRPHQLLSVTHAIARQELFNRWCENPSAGGSAWHVYDTDPICVTRAGEVWDAVMYQGSTNLPAGTSLVRVTQISGLDNRMQWGLSDAGLIVAHGLEEFSTIYHTGTGGTEMLVGATRQFDFTSWLTGNVAGTGPHPNARPFLVSGGGNPPIPSFQYCARIEYYAPGSSAYELPPAAERSDIELPDGTGATLDQLEVKLDYVQQHLRRTAGNLFNLDPTTMSGVGGLVSGQLLDAVGVLVNLYQVPIWVTQWVGDPTRFHSLATITFGNEDGWWPAIHLEHEASNILPIPLGATQYTLRCQPPVTGAVTLYRPTT